MTEREIRVLAVVAGAFPSLDTAVNVAFPSIDADFGLEVAGLQWIVVSYLATYAALLVPAGWLGDAIGHRRLVSIGAVLSAIGVAGCAAAPTFGIFLVGRVVQGMGTAFLYAGSPALLTTTAPGDGERGKAVSWFQAASMIGLTIGPVIGAPLVELGGWRAVYWFRVPAAALLWLLAAQRSNDRTASADTTGRLGPTGLGGLFRTPSFVRTNVANVVANAAMFPTWLLVPTLLIDEIGVAVITAGIVLALSPLMSATGSLWTGRQLGRRSPNLLARVGLFVQAAGLALLGWAGPAGSSPAVAAGMALVGAGIGVFSVPNMHVVMDSLPLDRQGVAGGLSVTMRSMGVVVGVLAASAIFDAVEVDRGFDGAFRVVFWIAAAMAMFAAAVSPGATNARD